MNTRIFSVLLALTLTVPVFAAQPDDKGKPETSPATSKGKAAQAPGATRRSMLPKTPTDPKWADYNQQRAKMRELAAELDAALAKAPATEHERIRVEWEKRNASEIDGLRQKAEAIAGTAEPTEKTDKSPKAGPEGPAIPFKKKEPAKVEEPAGLQLQTGPVSGSDASSANP